MATRRLSSLVSGGGGGNQDFNDSSSANEAQLAKMGYEQGMFKFRATITHHFEGRLSQTVAVYATGVMSLEWSPLPLPS